MSVLLRGPAGLGESDESVGAHLHAGELIGVRGVVLLPVEVDDAAVALQLGDDLFVEVAAPVEVGFGGCLVDQRFGSRVVVAAVVVGAVPGVEVGDVAVGVGAAGPAQQGGLEVALLALGDEG
ncbi:hypothetical protein [Saccharopolyspora rectivirgula]|uniref:hypothetical protein n=1 Tax=Saccharopolyspora rectivirgula TaxID=28042 RepID=UPI002409D2B3|nr:hypothetical protein [Saccharopolyspora rectivirgula]